MHYTSIRAESSALMETSGRRNVGSRSGRWKPGEPFDDEYPSGSGPDRRSSRRRRFSWPDSATANSHRCVAAARVPGRFDGGNRGGTADYQPVPVWGWAFC